MGIEGARDVIGKNGDSSGGEARPRRFVDSESLQLPLLAGCLAAVAAVAGRRGVTGLLLRLKEARRN